MSEQMKRPRRPVWADDKYKTNADAFGFQDKVRDWGDEAEAYMDQQAATIKGLQLEIQGADNVLSTYRPNGTGLLHDRVYAVTGKLEQDIEKQAATITRLEGILAAGDDMAAHNESAWDTLVVDLAEQDATITRLREALKLCRTSYCGYAITAKVDPLNVLQDFLQELFRIRDIANAALTEGET